MVHKPITIMILPVFVAGILMLGILAATGNAQESSNTGNRQHTFLPETEENNAHFAQESNNHPMCLNEHTEKWEPCVVKNSSKKHESSNTPSQEEKTKGEKTNPETTQGENTQGGKVAQESSNNGKAHESSKTEQSSVPVRPAITLTPIRAHITTKANIAEVSKSGKLTEKQGPQITAEMCKRVGPAGWFSLYGECFKLLHTQQAKEDCDKIRGSFICLPKGSMALATAPHTGGKVT